MKEFMDQDFMLQNNTAKTLYHDYAENLPIIDFHCHLSPKEIAENKKYKNITEVWLGGDHYKWRAIRSNGIEEKYITGEADDKTKFMKWAQTMPYMMGNPLYHWTHLELKRYFGINSVLSPDTAEEIWETCNSLLQQDDFSARSLIIRSGVETICTTDDPVDSLEYHQRIKADKSFQVKVLPALRPDKAINVEQEGYPEYVRELEAVSGQTLSGLADLKAVLKGRLDFFHENGCRLSDHALECAVYAQASEAQVEDIFQKGCKNESLSRIEIAQYKTHLLKFFGREYAERGWTMQLHLGAIRNNNTRMLRQLGPDTGFDAMGDDRQAKALALFLNSLDTADMLPKTILYCLNPYDNDVLTTIMGCFQGSVIPGKIQFGSAWWFNDHKDGMEKQMITLANHGLLRRFVGMLTDSRSFLSYTRHEYFRRILCNMLGRWAEDGEVPSDMNVLGDMVREISYLNAKNYFGM